MSYALVSDVPASWDRYARLAQLLDRAPSGLLLHVAGPTDEGFRIIEIWESEAAWRRFEPTLLAAIAALDADVRPLPRMRDVRAAHEVKGAAWVAGAGTTHTDR